MKRCVLQRVGFERFRNTPGEGCCLEASLGRSRLVGCCGSRFESPDDVIRDVIVPYLLVTGRAYRHADVTRLLRVPAYIGLYIAHSPMTMARDAACVRR